MLSKIEEFTLNYKKIFKLKGYLDKNYIKLNPKKTAKVIKKLRLKNHYSQYTLADRLNISRQAISKWERAESIPSRETLLKLSKIFNISINDLL